MTSYAIEVIQKLPSFRRNSDSIKSNNWHFGKIAHLLKQTTKDVENRWEELLEDERESLKVLAYDILNPSNEGNISQQHSWKSL